MKKVFTIFLALTSLSAFANWRGNIPRNSSVKIVFTTGHKYCFVTYSNNSEKMAEAQDAINRQGELQEAHFQLDNNFGNVTVRNLFAFQKSSCEGSVYVNDELVENFELKAEDNKKSDAEVVYSIS